MEYRVCVSTDKGTVREVNQDSVMVKVANTEKSGRIVMGVLCDGMGGLSHGELASAAVVERFKQWFTGQLPAELEKIGATESLDEPPGECDIIADIRHQWMSLAADMNLRIVQYGMEHGTALGTTLVSFLMIGNQFIVMNVGDSRVYMLTEDKIDLLTHDHSIVQDMIDRGLMTRQEADESPQKSVLLQCIGASGGVSPQFVRGVIGEDTSIILCSDGFWRKLTDEDFLGSAAPKCCIDEETMKKNMDSLVDTVKSRGETDNISAILLNFKF